MKAKDINRSKTEVQRVTPSGLSVGRVKIGIDVDGTLIKKSFSGEDVPRYDVLSLLHLLHNFADIYVWSGSGFDYATRWCEKLGIDNIVKVVPKGGLEVDLTLDDEDITLGKVNIKV